MKKIMIILASKVGKILQENVVTMPVSSLKWSLEVFIVIYHVIERDWNPAMNLQIFQVKRRYQSFLAIGNSK